MDETVKKKRLGGGVKALIVVLIVLLLLAGLPFLYLSLGFPIDDAERLAAAAPMPSAERYTFHAAEQTVDIAVDRSDAAWLILEQGGLADTLAEAEKTLAPYGLTLSQYGMRFFENKLLLDAKLLYKKFLPLPLRAELSLSGSRGAVRIDVDAVWIGRLIRIPADKLPLPSELRSFVVDVSDIHSRMKTFTALCVEGDRLVVTSPVGPELVAEALENFGQVEAYADYLGNFEAIDVGRAVHNGDFDGCFSTLLASFEKDPAHFLEFKRSALAIAEDYKAGLYFTNGDSALLPRFLPELTKESVEALSLEYDTEMGKRRDQLKTIVRNLQLLNEARSLSADGKGFYHLAKGNAPLTLSALSDGTGYAEWLDESTARVVWGVNASVYMKEKLDRISIMPKAAPDAFNGMKGGEIYVPVLILQTASNRPVAAFYANLPGDAFMTKLLTETEYAACMQSARTPMLDLDLAYYL